jgi:hypothetical protein
MFDRSRVQVIFQPKTWLDEDITRKWLDEEFFPFKDNSNVLLFLK